jgi:hypothetical protein
MGGLKLLLMDVEMMLRKDIKNTCFVSRFWFLVSRFSVFPFLQKVTMQKRLRQAQPDRDFKPLERLSP